MLTTALLRCRAGLGALGAVLRAALLAILNASGVEGSANNVITHARKIFHTAAAHKHDRVFLQVVADTWNIGGDFNGIGEAHASNLAQRGVRFLWRLGI